MTPAEATEKLLRMGNLRPLLSPVQRTWWDLYHSTRGELVLEVSRRLGKTFFESCLCASACIKNMNRGDPPIRIVYIAQTIDNAREICRDVFSMVEAALPPDIRPRMLGGDWVFPDGSRVSICGANDQKSIQNIRGGTAWLVLVDEAAYIPGLESLMAVVYPMLQTTGGRCVVVSSSGFPGDAFQTKCQAARKHSRYAWSDWTGEGHLPMERKLQMVTDESEATGYTLEEFQRTSRFRREYLSQPCQDDELGIYPGMNESLVLLEEVTPPEHFGWFLGIDPGNADAKGDDTGIVAGFYDHRTQRLVVRSERLLKRGDSPSIVDAAVSIGEEGWTRGQEPDVVVIDDPTGRLQFDLRKRTGWNVKLADKHFRLDWVDRLTVRMRRKEIVFYGVPQTVLHLLNAASKSPGGDMVRTPRFGHFDLADACLYMSRAATNYERDRTPEPTEQPGHIYGPTRLRRLRPKKGLGTIPLQRIKLR